MGTTLSPSELRLEKSLLFIIWIFVGGTPACVFCVVKLVQLLRPIMFSRHY